MSIVQDARIGISKCYWTDMIGSEDLYDGIQEVNATFKMEHNRLLTRALHIEYMIPLLSYTSAILLAPTLRLELL